MILRLPIAPDTPYVRGHFPGRPIVPGVALLDLLLAGLAAEGGYEPALTGIPSLRWRRPVTPGEVLEATLDDAGAPSRFELRRGVDLVCNGSLLFGTANPLPETVPGQPVPGSGIEAAELLPHVPPARLVERVVSHDGTSLVATARIPPGSPFAIDDRTRALVGLEIAAQAAAALETLRRTGTADAGTRQGYLVGVKNAVFAEQRLPVDEPLVIAIREAGVAPPLAQYNATLAFPDGISLMSATVSTFVEW